jgi:hypothetical protein
LRGRIQPKTKQKRRRPLDFEEDAFAVEEQVGQEADGDEGQGEGQRSVLCAAVEGEEVVVDPEPGSDGLAIGSISEGILSQIMFSTMKTEMQKTVMALEPKTSQGKVSHFPALVSLKWRMSISQ